MIHHVIDPDGTIVASGKAPDQAIAQAEQKTLNSWDNLYRAGWRQIEGRARLSPGWWILPGLAVAGALICLAWRVSA